MVEKHVLICGEIGVGKSTLIRKLLDENTRPIGGFITKRISRRGELPVYIHPAFQLESERLYTQENLIGTSRDHCFPDVFDHYGVTLLASKQNGLILMDELGFMESQAAGFCEAVLRVLDGDVPILAAIKKQDTPFLRAVKMHPNAEVFEIDRQNRDDLYERLRPRIRQWNLSVLPD